MSETQQGAAVGGRGTSLAWQRVSPLILHPASFIARDWLPMLVLALAALSLCWPLLASPRSRIIGPPVGDNVQYVYMTGWVGQSLLLGQSPLVDPRLNFPGTLALATTDAPFLSMLLAAPFTWALGPVFAYNLIIVASGWLSGYGAYLWVRAISGSRLGGLVAGLAFMLAPFRVAHSYGHLQLVATQGLPLFFWALDAAARGDGGRVGDGGRAGEHRVRPYALLAAATALVGAGAMYYLLIALTTGALYALAVLAGRLRAGEHKVRRDEVVLGTGAGMVLAVGVGALLSALPYLAVWRAGGFVAYSLDEIRKRSANPLDFVLPSILHPLWGERLQAWLPGLPAEWIERTLYLGAVPLALGAVALWPGGEWRRYRLPWLATALLGVVLALGTDLHWNNQPLAPDAPFWLPAAYLVHLPFASLLRVWTRFAIVPILFVALFAGLGAARLSAKRKAQSAKRSAAARFAVPVLVIVLLLVDLAPGTIGAGDLRPRPIDAWLAQQPGDFAAAFLPQIDDGVNYVAMYGSLFHGKHLPAYNHPAHKSADYDRFRDLADRFPVTAETFHRLGLRYLLLHRADYDGARFPAWGAVERVIAGSPTLRIVAEVDGYVVVETRQK